MPDVRALEVQVQATVVELATLRGWQGYHTHDSRRSRSGFPDLVLWRDRTVFAELKRQGERPRAEQIVALDGLARAGAKVYVWTLDDLDEVATVLGRYQYDPVSQRIAVSPYDEWWTPRTLWIPEREEQRRAA